MVFCRSEQRSETGDHLSWFSIAVSTAISFTICTIQHSQVMNSGEKSWQPMLISNSANKVAMWGAPPAG